MQINIKENIYGLNLDDLMIKGYRANNPKRNFLFISTVLGKHIELKPDVCRLAGYLLASRLSDDSELTKNIVKAFKESDYKNINDLFKNFFRCKEDILVLGFAETATGLGMSVASSIEDSYYLTTTREEITEIESLLKFEEEHSHATTHKCFLLDKERLLKAERIVLVDDEITTGKSMLNIIKELKRVTNIKNYTILSILDWRNKEYLDLYDSFIEEEDIDLEVLSLISGEIKIEDTTTFYDKEEKFLEGKIKLTNLNSLDRIELKTSHGLESYIKDSGRFGVEFKDIRSLEEKCKDIARDIEKELGALKKTLVLGHGENIYIPSRIAAYLNGEVYFKTTTRSPIYACKEEFYPIKEKHIFYDNDIKYYFYNKDKIERNYDRVILLTENDLNIKLTKNISIFKI